MSRHIMLEASEDKKPRLVLSIFAPNALWWRSRSTRGPTKAADVKEVNDEVQAARTCCKHRSPTQPIGHEGVSDVRKDGEEDWHHHCSCLGTLLRIRTVFEGPMLATFSGRAMQNRAGQQELRNTAYLSCRGCGCMLRSFVQNISIESLQLSMTPERDPE